MIETIDLHKRHGKLEVLRGISLAVAEGEVAVIVGPSGGGKSTFLRCLNGLEKFEAGEVRVGEHRLAPGEQDRQTLARLQLVRREVGMVFQQFNLFPHLTVLQNVTEAPQRVLKLSRDEAISRAKAILDRVGLADKLNERPERLSGGQQQRVAIARALAMQPRAILFDEPTSALDPRMTAEVLAVLADLASSGQTMVVVTHAMNFARRAAHRVHVFQDGQVLESGPPQQIFENPREKATAEFVREQSGP
ncbi:MAG TPA: amino acid ABC transporter ATP-binding protein [Pirellulales bacterium]|jgi:polar amino acid transport system ATP-binding protein|nr:amino acid ABC transporter ATP-binding protein [Pirellulales bacterium]